MAQRNLEPWASDNVFPFNINPVTLQSIWVPFTNFTKFLVSWIRSQEAVLDFGWCGSSGASSQPPIHPKLPGVPGQAAFCLPVMLSLTGISFLSHIFINYSICDTDIHISSSSCDFKQEGRVFPCSHGIMSLEIIYSRDLQLCPRVLQFRGYLWGCHGSE